MSEQKTIAFFPKGAFGPASSSVGIAQSCRALGHRCVFLRDPGFAGVFEGHGFEEFEVNLSEPMDPEEMAKYWSDFINGHIPNSRKSPYEQRRGQVAKPTAAPTHWAKSFGLARRRIGAVSIALTRQRVAGDPGSGL